MVAMDNDTEQTLRGILCGDPYGAAGVILDTPAVVTELARERGRRGGLMKSAAQKAARAQNAAKAADARRGKRKGENHE